MEYRKGKENAAADALSRMPHLCILQAVSNSQPEWLQELLNSYATDPTAQQHLAQLAIKILMVKALVWIEALSGTKGSCG